MNATDAAAEVVENVREFTVHEANVTRAFELVEKVNKRARRYGLAEYVLHKGQATEHPIYATQAELDADPENPFFQAPMLGGERPVIGYETTYEMVLIGEMPRIDGWSFVATLDYAEVEDDGDGRVITRVVPGVEVDLSTHRVRPNECDHCGKIRYRANTYVLLNKTTGETMQVGSSCIQPYMGLTVNGLAWLADDPFAELDDMGEQDRDRGGYSRIERKYDVDYVLTTTAGIVSVKGWVSQAAATFQDSATSSIVKDILDPPTSESENARLARKALMASIDWDAAKVTAEAVKAWAVAEDGGTNEWRTNVRILASGKAVTWRNIGVLASAIAGYRRATQEAAEKAVAVPSEWIGNVKDKINMDGVVSNLYAGESDWGMYEWVTVKRDGATIKWKSSRITGFQVGDKVTGTGTVKGHDEYRGEKQTIVTRAKLEKVEG